MTDEEKSGEKQGGDWRNLVAEKAETLGLPGGELREAVQRELIKRAAIKIADELDAQPGRMRPIKFG